MIDELWQLSMVCIPVQPPSRLTGYECFLGRVVTDDKTGCSGACVFLPASLMLVDVRSLGLASSLSAAFVMAHNGPSAASHRQEILAAKLPAMVVPRDGVVVIGCNSELTGGWGFLGTSQCSQ